MSGTCVHSDDVHPSDTPLGRLRDQGSPRRVSESVERCLVEPTTPTRGQSHRVFTRSTDRLPSRIVPTTPTPETRPTYTHCSSGLWRRKYRPRRYHLILPTGSRVEDNGFPFVHSTSPRPRGPVRTQVTDAETQTRTLLRRSRGLSRRGRDTTVPGTLPRTPSRVGSGPTSPSFRDVRERPRDLRTRDVPETSTRVVGVVRDVSEYPQTEKVESWVHTGPGSLHFPRRSAGTTVRY